MPAQLNAPEAALASTPGPGPLEEVRVTPTQVRRPWRATARTAFAALVALCALFPVLVETAGLDPASFPWLAVPIAVAAAVTRIMALPGVEEFLRRFLPFLSATGKQPDPNPEAGEGAIGYAVLVLLVLAIVVVLLRLL